jgi:hypothetical protein
MKKLFGVLLAIAALSSVSFAQSGFAGGSLSPLFIMDIDEFGSDLTIGFLGGQVGSYDLAGPVGARATIDFSVTPISGFLSGSADVLFSSTGDAKFYGGAGVGIISFFGLSAPFGKVFVGGDFAVSDLVSLFAEAAPIYVFQSQTFAPVARLGVNFAFGQ